MKYTPMINNNNLKTMLNLQSAHTFQVLCTDNVPNLTQSFLSA